MAKRMVSNQFGTYEVTAGTTPRIVLHVGQRIKTFDSDTREGYLAEVVEQNERPRQDTTLVRILRVMHYPIQTAIMQDTLCERSPLMEGDICRLMWADDATPGDEAFFLRMTWEESARRARRRYREAVSHYADTDRGTDHSREQLMRGILSILDRHDAGEYHERNIMRQ